MVSKKAMSEKLVSKKAMSKKEKGKGIVGNSPVMYTLLFLGVLCRGGEGGEGLWKSKWKLYKWVDEFGK